jgi:hypothetical protein
LPISTSPTKNFDETAKIFSRCGQVYDFSAKNRASCLASRFALGRGFPY